MEAAGGDDSFLTYAERKADLEGLFQLGDRVRIIEGQMAGLTCKIERIADNGEFVLKPVQSVGSKVGDEFSNLQMSSTGFLKFFEVGNRVKITRGENTGEIGCIVKIEEKKGSATLTSETADAKGWPLQFQANLNYLIHSREKGLERQVKNQLIHIGCLVSDKQGRIGIVCTIAPKKCNVLLSD